MVRLNERTCSLCDFCGNGSTLIVGMFRLAVGFLVSGLEYWSNGIFKHTQRLCEV